MSYRACAIAVVTACGSATTTRHALTNTTATRPAIGAEHDVELDGDCDLLDAPRVPLDDVGQETLAIVTCDSETAHGMTDETHERQRTMHLLRRSKTDTRGTSIELGSWIIASEQNEWYEVVGSVFDAAGRATHVLIVHGRGGLDQAPEQEVLDYLPATHAFAATKYAGSHVAVQVAPDRAQATITICTLGGRYDEGKECEEETDSQTRIVTIGAP